MKKFLLIFKNWIKSLWKIKITFGIFLLLCFITGAILSTFIEVNQQFSQQKTQFQLNDPEFAKRDLYQGITGRFNQDASYHLFCTDYFEVTKIDQDNKKQLKRLPKLTFGTKDSCFKTPILFNDSGTHHHFGTHQINFKQSQINSADDFVVFDRIKINDLPFNEASKYYQNSLHGQIMKKYRETNQTKYLYQARKLERQFKPIIINKLNEALERSLLQDDFFQNYLKLVPQFQANHFHEALNHLETIVNNLPVYNQNLQNQFDHLKTKIDVTKSNNNLENNQKLWAKWLEKAKKWTKILQTQSPSTLTETNFVKSLENKIKNWSLAVSAAQPLTISTQTLSDIVKHPNYFVNWVTKIAPIELSGVNNIDQKNKIAWLLANTTQIMDHFRKNSENYYLKIWFELEAFANEITEFDQVPEFPSWFKTIDHDGNPDTVQLSWKELMIKVENMQLSTSFFNDIIFTLNQNREYLTYYRFLKWYFVNQDSVDKIYDQIVTFMRRLNPKNLDKLINQAKLTTTDSEIIELTNQWNNNQTDITSEKLSNWHSLIKFRFTNLNYWVHKMAGQILKINDWTKFLQKTDGTQTPIVMIEYDDNNNISNIEINSKQSIISSGVSETAIQTNETLLATANMVEKNYFVLPTNQIQTENFFDLDSFINLWVSNHLGVTSSQTDLKIYFNNWEKFLTSGNELLTWYFEQYLEPLKDLDLTKLPTGLTEDSFLWKPWNVVKPNDDLAWLNRLIDHMTAAKTPLMKALQLWRESLEIAPQYSVTEEAGDRLQLALDSNDIINLIKNIFLDYHNQQRTVNFDSTINSVQAISDRLQTAILKEKLTEFLNVNPTGNTNLIDHDGAIQTSKKNLQKIFDEINAGTVTDVLETLIHFNLLYLETNIPATKGNLPNDFRNTLWNQKFSRWNFLEKFVIWIKKWKASQVIAVTQSDQNPTEIYQTLLNSVNQKIQTGFDIFSPDTQAINYYRAPNDLWDHAFEQILNNYFENVSTWTLTDTNLNEITDWFVNQTNIPESSNIPRSWLNLNNNQHGLIINNKNWFNYLDVGAEVDLINPDLIADVINNESAFSGLKIEKITPKFREQDWRKIVVTKPYYFTFQKTVPNTVREKIQSEFKEFHFGEIKKELNDIASIKDTLTLTAVTFNQDAATADNVVAISDYHLQFDANPTDTQKNDITAKLANIKWEDKITKHFSNDQSYIKYGLKNHYPNENQIKKDPNRTFDNGYFEITTKESLTPERITELKIALNQKFTSLIKEKITNFKNWIIKDSMIAIDSPNPDAILSWHKIAAELVGINAIPLIKTYVKEEISGDAKINRKYLIIRENDNPQYQLIAGEKPITSQELIVSPLTARNLNYQVGQNIDFLLIKNLKITGIGVQKEFIHPKLYKFQIDLPDKTQSMMYFNQEMYYLFKTRYLKHQKQSIYFDETETMFLEYQPDDSPTVRQKKRDQMSEYLGFGAGNFTQASLNINQSITSKKTSEQTPSEIVIKDYNFSPLNIINISENPDLNFIQLNQIVKFNGQWIMWSLVVVLILFFFIIGFAGIYIVEKKINLNKEPIGILKSLGMKNLDIWIASIPIAIIIFVTNLLGWIVGVFLQLSIFNTLEQYLNFTFVRYSFDLGNLFLSFGFVILVIICTMIYYEKRKFAKKNVLSFLNAYESHDNWFVQGMKNHVLAKVPKIKNSLLKINYVFFATLWKKILFLFIIFGITAFSVMSGILVLTIRDETINRTYKNLNYSWKFNYMPVVSDNPFTRKRYWSHSGLDKVLAENKENNYQFFENNNFDFYKRSAETEKKITFDENVAPEKFQTSLNTNFGFMQPLHHKSFTNATIERILRSFNPTSYKEAEVFVCKSVLNQNETPGIKDEFKSGCIRDLIYANVPFNVNDKRKNIILKNNFPLSVGVVDYQKSGNDEFFTEIKGRIKNTNDNFEIIGLNSNTNAFKLPASLKKRVFEKQNQASTLNPVIEVIANSNFLITHNYRVGQTITKDILIDKPHFYYKNFKTPFKKENWVYHKQNGEKILLIDIPQDAQFYNSELLSRDLQEKINNREIQLLYRGDVNPNYQWEGPKVPYSDGSYASQYREWIDVARINLTLPSGDVVYPFRGDPDGKHYWQGSKMTWFAERAYKKELYNMNDWEEMTISTNSKQSNNQAKTQQKLTFKIVGEVKEYKKEKLLIPQKYANLLLDYPTDLAWNKQYRWFNGKYSLYHGDNPWTPIYNHGWSNEFGYNNFEMIHLFGGDARKDQTASRSPVSLEKQIITEYANYFIGISMILIVVCFLLICFMFVWLTKSSLYEVRNISLKLKLFGYSSRLILWQTIQHIVIPFFISFILGTWLAIFTMTSLSNYMISEGIIFMFFSNNFWLCLIALIPILLILLGIIIINHRKNDQAILANEINIV